MQSFGAFGKPCAKHPSNFISNVCIFDNCPDRILCAECQLSHDLGHKNHFKSVLEVLMFNADAEHQRAKKLGEELKSCLDKEIEKLDEFLLKLKKKFDECLVDIRNEVINKLTQVSRQQSAHLFEGNKLDELKEEYEKKKSTCFGMATDIDDQDVIRKTREEYAEVYSSLCSQKSLVEQILNNRPRLSATDHILEQLPIQKIQEAVVRVITAPLDTLKEKLILESIKAPWTWDPNMKHPSLVLKDGNVNFEKVDGTGDSFIFGNKKLCQGRNEWKVTVSTGGSGGYVCFGIMDATYVNSIDSIPYKKGIYFVTSNVFHNMIKVKELPNYDNKTYVCVLDFDEDYFRILHEGTVIAETKRSFKGETFLPMSVVNKKGCTLKLSF
jgi:hypothetical protein